KKQIMGIAGFLMYGLAITAQPLPQPSVPLPQFRADTCLITDFGAGPDLHVLQTAAIQKAIDQCSARGGGVVLIPEGIWTSGPLQLRNNVNLHLTRNALLQFTTDFEQYPL